MNRNRTAALLVACAIVLAVGAFFLVTNKPVEQHTLRQEVPIPEETATPPAWVGKEQETKPDYSAAVAKPVEEKATPEEVTPEKPKVIEISEDKIVTFGFVDALVNYSLGNFIPKDKNGRPATTASAKGVNIYFGQDLAGFKTKGNDINSGRKAILDYAFTPKKIEFLYNLYAPLLVEQLVDTATNDAREYKIKSETENRSLNDPEIAAMLRLIAVRIDQTATVLKTIASDPSITSMAGQYIQAAKNVDRANEQLQAAIADSLDTSVLGQRLKQAIMQREERKEAIVDRMKTSCIGCSTKELFYLAKWSYRRALTNKEASASFDAASGVLDDLAKRFLDKAAELDK